MIGQLGDFHILSSGIPEGEIRWAFEATCRGDVLASEEVSSSSLVQSVGCVDAVPAQVVEGICTRRHTDSGHSVSDIPSTEVVLVEVVFATLSTACRQWLCHICSFQCNWSGFSIALKSDYILESLCRITPDNLRNDFIGAHPFIYNWTSCLQTGNNKMLTADRMQSEVIMSSICWPVYSWLDMKRHIRAHSWWPCHGLSTTSGYGHMLPYHWL